MVLMLDLDYIVLTEEGGNTIFTFTTSSLGYDLESDDEIIAYGKFNA